MKKKKKRKRKEFGPLSNYGTRCDISNTRSEETKSIIFDAPKAS